MQIVKRNGSHEEAKIDKILASITSTCKDLPFVDPYKIATKTIGGLYDGATTKELDELSISTAIGLISEEPENSKAAARILMNVIHKEVQGQSIESFSQSISRGHECKLIDDDVLTFVKKNSRKLNAATKNENDNLFEYFGLKTVYDRYLLRHPVTRKIIETPQYFFMRVACGLFHEQPKETVDFFRLLSTHQYMTSTPTLFNSGTRHPQMSSCYLLDSPKDDLIDIYKKYSDIAQLSKWAGGIGVSWSNVRGEGSLIKGTNGLSDGIVPWLNTLNASIGAVNQGGKRRGACAVYLESWHCDVEAFLELRNNTGDEDRRTHNINIVNWISDEFMRRVENDQEWTLISPDYKDDNGNAAINLTNTFGDKFVDLYTALETSLEATEDKPRWYKKIRAVELYGKMMTTLSTTGNGWMTFKDQANMKSNQVTEQSDEIIKTSNLCTEILEIAASYETAVCNLGSLNLIKFVKDDGKIDWNKLAKTVKQAIIGLDKVIDINFYPIKESAKSNNAWRPIGLGVMGTQDVFFKLRLPFDSKEALEISEKLQSFIYYHAIKTSVELAKEFGHYENFKKSRSVDGTLQYKLWDVEPVKAVPGQDWKALEKDVAEFGTRNSLTIAIAPTATIASIVGSYECIEPQLTNIFKRSTLSGEFAQINKYLVDELKAINLWNSSIRNKIINADGSIQGIMDIPENIRKIYRTAWELSMKKIIDNAAIKAPYIDQSQSLNLFMENPNIGKLSSMYMYLWKKKLKTSYYLRSRGASHIMKVGTSTEYTPTESVVCSLENPGSCEACS